jgi:hypothetical protein
MKKETARQPEGPHGNRGIRHIEGGPVVRAYVEIEKINDFSEPDPINQVPRGSS